MVIEDDATMLSLLVALLEIEGFQVSQVSQNYQVHQVVQAIQQERPDLVLLDIQLSQFSGFELLDKLRQDAATSDLRVLISSGRDVGHECIQAGADDFIMKPFMPDELITKIHTLLG